MKYRALLLTISALALASLQLANAQDTPQSGLNTTTSKDPLEITANGSLEWQRDKKTLIARENAQAVQGSSSVKAQILIAEYREAVQGGDMQIWRVSADKNVVLHSNNSDAYGDKAIYDLDKGLATLTGNDLKMLSPDQTITAKDKFEYWVAEGRMNALGKAKIVRPKPTGGTDSLEADKISAVFQDDANGTRTLHSLEAIGNVTITTPTEIVTGAYGIYKAGTNMAEMTGGVKIKRGQNTLEGDRAEVDMNTNTSKIFGAPQAQSKVKAVFYPGSDPAANAAPPAVKTP